MHAHHTAVGHVCDLYELTVLLIVLQPLFIMYIEYVRTSIVLL